MIWVIIGVLLVLLFLFFRTATSSMGSWKTTATLMTERFDTYQSANGGHAMESLTTALQERYHKTANPTLGYMLDNKQLFLSCVTDGSAGRPQPDALLLVMGCLWIENNSMVKGLKQPQEYQAVMEQVRTHIQKMKRELVTDDPHQDHAIAQLFAELEPRRQLPVLRGKGEKTKEARQ